MLVSALEKSKGCEMLTGPPPAYSESQLTVAIFVPLPGLVGKVQVYGTLRVAPPAIVPAE